MTERRLSGSWILSPDSPAYDGELVIDEEEGVLALVLTIRKTEEDPFPAGLEVPSLICGTTSVGAKVTLYGCRGGHVHYQLLQFTQQVIYIRYAFWGIQTFSEDDLLFSRIDLDLGNITPWASLSRIESRFDDDGAYLCRWIHEEAISYQRDDGSTLEFVPTLKSTSNSFYEPKAVIEHGITVSLLYDEPVTWAAVLDDVCIAESLVSLGMHEDVSVQSMKYLPAVVDVPHDDPSVARALAASPPMREITVCAGRRSTGTKSRLYEYLFDLKQFAAVEGFEHWFAYYSRLKPVLNLYLMAFSEKVSSPEIYFLNLMQALETFHTRFVIDGRKAYRTRVEGLVASAFNFGGASKVERFLWSSQQDQYKAKIILKSRLADLFYADGTYPIPYSLSSCEKFLTRVTMSRHYYTHYDGRKAAKAFSKSELRDVNDILMIILEHHILVLLGFDANEVAGKTFSKIDRLKRAAQYFA